MGVFVYLFINIKFWRFVLSLGDLIYIYISILYTLVFFLIFMLIAIFQFDAKKQTVVYHHLRFWCLMLDATNASIEMGLCEPGLPYVYCQMALKKNSSEYNQSTAFALVCFLFKIVCYKMTKFRSIAGCIFCKLWMGGEGRRGGGKGGFGTTSFTADLFFHCEGSGFHWKCWIHCFSLHSWNKSVKPEQILSPAPNHLRPQCLLLQYAVKKNLSLEAYLRSI